MASADLRIGQEPQVRSHLHPLHQGMDENSPTWTWSAAADWAQREIERLRGSNDSMELDVGATAAIRGEIRALKRLLNEPKRIVQEQLAKSQAQPDTWELRNPRTMNG